MKNFSKASIKSADARLPELVVEKRDRNTWIGGPEMVMEEAEPAGQAVENEDSDFASL